MPFHEFTAHSGSERWQGDNLASYKPAYPLGNLRDAILIARSSGRPVGDFLYPRPTETPDYIPEAWEIIDDSKEG